MIRLRTGLVVDRVLCVNCRTKTMLELVGAEMLCGRFLESKQTLPAKSLSKYSHAIKCMINARPATMLEI